MQILNEMNIEFLSISENESLARIAAAAFISPKDPSVEVAEEIKTAVSEAVTNSIIHGYEDREGMVHMKCRLYEDYVSILVTDAGKGIEDVGRAREPLFTTKADMERSGMGFTIMENFMDEVKVHSALGEGTSVELIKYFLNAGHARDISKNL